VPVRLSYPKNGCWLLGYQYFWIINIYVRHIKGRLNNQLIIIGYLVDYKVFNKIKIKIIFCYFGF